LEEVNNETINLRQFTVDSYDLIIC